MFDYCAQHPSRRHIKAPLRAAISYCTLQQTQEYVAGQNRMQNGYREGNLLLTGGLSLLHDCIIRTVGLFTWHHNATMWAGMLKLYFSLQNETQYARFGGKNSDNKNI